MKNVKNNKGFSLVELIIVIAIMAVLIGILAPQYMKYVERSRLSADNDYIDSVRQACETAVSDPSTQITNNFTVTFSTAGDPTINDATAQSEIDNIIDIDGGDGALTSRTYQNAGAANMPVITVEWNPDPMNNNILVPEVTVTNVLQ